jgi:hypothetical protein
MQVRNSPETPESENAKKMGVSDDFPARKIDRRVSVAPMMDWTDDVLVSFEIKELNGTETACLLRVSSKKHSNYRTDRHCRRDFQVLPVPYLGYV